MAIPFVIAAGMTVLATAKAVSWICNVMSEKEREQQRAERNRSDNLREKATAAKAQQSAASQQLFKQMGQEHAEMLFGTIRQHREAVAEVPSELEKLEFMISSEVSDKTSSPYRKSALRREYARIEDAIVRIKEYNRYLDFEEHRVKNYLLKENYELLLKLDTAEPLLPLEWLYPGKLVIVSMDEIGRELPRFGHRISFGKDDRAQRTLALQYNDDIPVLIRSSHKDHPGLFYGCVARGALYYHHIMPDEPVEFTVDRISKGTSANGTLFEGILRATLPLSELNHPGVRLLSGQKILVYPTHYDLCLRRNPFAEKSTIQVSEFNYQNRSSQSYQQIYLVVDESQLRDLTDQRFFDPDEPWTLLCLSSETGFISLAKATIRLECLATSDLKLIEVQNFSQSSSILVGLDTPFRFTLIDRKLANDEEIGWVHGVQEFLRFCAQAALDMNDSPERMAQGRFYQRWEQVIAYQRNREEIFALDFQLDIADLKDNILFILRDSIPINDQDNFDNVASMLSEVLSNKNHLNPDNCVQLQQWSDERHDYIPALADRRNRLIYSCSKNSISIEGNFSRLNKCTGVLRLLISVPSIPLKRQHQALDDFLNDRLINPQLKNILLSPDHYIPDQIYSISNIEWSGDLDESQKRVVNLALRERNIALIQGPPGAGKTTAIVEMLYQLFNQNPSRKVLIVSQQNTAVDNAMSRFLEIHGGSFSVPIKAIRIGNPEKIHSSIQPLSFDRQHAEYLALLEASAVKAAVSLPEDQTLLCHMWLATLKQATQSRNGQDEFFITLLADRNLVGATCVGLASNKGGIDQLQFDIAIIDEAGRSTVPEILIPILRSSKVILVGDHHQLPPSISPLLREDEASQELNFLRDNFLNESFFELMFERLPSQCREILDRQYRMAPAIGDLVANLFYCRDNHRVLFNGHPDSFFEKRYILEECIYWVDVKGQQQQPRNSTSQQNDLEAREITRFLENLAERVREHTSVAVITPYGAQKQRIREQLSRIKWTDGKLGKLTIAVDTVDAFQGSEADIVCYSTVRTKGKLDFILDRKRLNVACSRARLHLLFFGDRKYLSSWRGNEQSGVNLFPEIINYACTKSISFIGPVHTSQR